MIALSSGLRPQLRLALFWPALLVAQVHATLESRPEPDVLVVADALEPMPASFQPSPGKPVPYVLLGQIERALGHPVANEAQLEAADLESRIVKTLATQGYVRTKVGDVAPALAIVVTWGTANLLQDEFSGPDGSGFLTLNAREMAVLVGLDKVESRLMSQTDADALNDAVRRGRLYVYINAFDARALARREKILLWRVRISIDSARHSLPESLEAMLASAAPFLGRDLERPVFVDDRTRKARVFLGELKVLPDEPASPTPRKEP